MYARVIINRIRPGMEEEALRAAYAGIAANKQQSGYKGQMYLMAPETNQSILISLWEENPSQHTFDSSYQKRMEQATSLLAEPIVPEIYEVKILE
jgi:heme-degrading monooxygenase HmoA